jgi:hypothetical protein
MILQRTNRVSLTASESMVFCLLGPNTDGVAVFLENVSNINYISYRVQTSSVNDDNSYVDLTTDTNGNFSPSGILAPGTRSFISIRTTQPFIRLLAISPGGSDLNVSVSQFISTNSVYYTNGVQ